MSLFVLIWRVLASLSLVLGVRPGFGTGLIRCGGIGFLCATGNAQAQGVAGISPGWGLRCCRVLIPAVLIQKLFPGFLHLCASHLYHTFSQLF
jgi:hypothetical protein